MKQILVSMRTRLNYTVFTSSIFMLHVIKRPPLLKKYRYEHEYAELVRDKFYNVTNTLQHVGICCHTAKRSQNFVLA